MTGTTVSGDVTFLFLIGGWDYGVDLMKFGHVDSVSKHCKFSELKHWIPRR